mgnify:CR=1 FL=1|jgi:hypothetical protein
MITLKRFPIADYYRANKQHRGAITSKSVSWFNRNKHWEDKKHDLSYGAIRKDLENAGFKVEIIVIEWPSSVAEGWGWQYDSGTKLMKFSRAYLAKRKRTQVGFPLQRKSHKSVEELPLVPRWFAKWRRVCRIVFHEETDYRYTTMTLLTKRRDVK